MADAEKILGELSQKDGVLGTIVMTSEGVPIRSDFPENETNLYSSLVSYFVHRTQKALEEIEEAEEAEIIRIRSKKNEIVIAPYGNYIFVAVQDPFNVKK